MKRRLFLLSALFALALVIFPAPASAASSSSSSTTVDSAYTTQTYDVSVKVHKNHAYTVTESIDVNFVTSRHGIYRYIPYTGSYYRLVDGKPVTVSYTARVTDISATGGDLKVTRENGNVVLRLGDADTLVSGPKHYTIKYTWDPGDDGVSQFDDVYFNVLPSRWPTAIDSATVTITMPKKFDADNVHVYSGAYGSTTNLYFTTDVVGRTITIRNFETLPANTGATLNLRLPEGYFTGERNGREAFPLVYIACAAGAALAILVYAKANRRKKIVETVGFYPPHGFDPAITAGILKHGDVKSTDLVACIFTLADKGYITIEETGKNTFAFHKKKEIDYALPNHLIEIYNGLTKEGEVTTSLDIEDSFYKNAETAKEEVKMFFDQSGHDLDDVDAKRRRWGLFALTLIPSAVYAWALCLAIEGVFYAFSFFFPLIGTVFFTSLLFWTASTIANGERMVKGGAKIAGSLIVTLIVGFIFVIISAGNGRGPITAALTATLVFIALLQANIEPMTDQGRTWVGEVLGFRRFIATAEADRLKALVDDNPSYFYNILPYAYIFGISKKWAKKFESLVTEPPAWYTGYDSWDTFNALYFANVFGHTMTAMDHSMIQVPASASGGSSSFGGGGGFSGGGGGGGGGGSW